MGLNSSCSYWVQRLSVFTGAVLLAVGFFGGSAVYADGFYPSGDSANCDFAQTVSLSVGSLPVSNEVPGGLSYDAGEVEGEGAGYVGGHRFSDLAEIRFPYARRYLGVADRVGVPPLTRVEVGLYTHNYSGHNISIDSGYLFLTNSDQSGSFVRLGAKGSYREISYMLSGKMLVRKGIGVDVPVQGVYQSHGINNPPYGKDLYSFNVSQPISFKVPVIRSSYDVLGNAIVHIEQGVSNSSDYILSTKFQHNGFESNTVINANSEVVFNYDINLGKVAAGRVNLGYAKLFVQNEVTECVSQGGDSGVNGSPDSRVLFTSRNDLGAPSGWVGLQVDFPFVPFGNTLCITRIPYQINSNDLVYDLKPEFILEANLSDLDEVGLKEIKMISGNEFDLNIKVQNVDADARDVQVGFNVDVGYAVVGSDCVLRQGEEGVMFWDIGELDHNVQSECRIRLNSPVDLLENLDTTVLVDVCSGGDYCKYETMKVHVSPVYRVKVSKTASKSTVRNGEEIAFTINVENWGGDLEGVILRDTCYGCEVLSDGAVSGDLLLNRDIYIPQGVYSIVVLYSVKDGVSHVLKNCIDLRTAGGNLPIESSCVEVQYIGSEGRNIGANYFNPNYLPVQPSLVDTDLRVDEMIHGINIGLESVEMSKNNGTNTTLKLAYTGEKYVVEAEVIALIIVVAMFVFRRRIW